MALTPKTWRLASYTPDTYTDLITATGAPVVLKGLIISSASGTPTVRVRTANAAGVEQTSILAGEALVAGASYALDLPLLVLATGEKLQVSASAAGVSFTASGVQ